MQQSACLVLNPKVSEYDQEIPQSHTADQPTAPIMVYSYGFLFNSTTDHDCGSGLRLNDGSDVKL